MYDELSLGSKILCVKPSEILEAPAQKSRSPLRQESGKFWNVSAHCSSLLFPTPLPDIQFDSCSCSFNFLLHASNSRPGQDFVTEVRQAHYRVLSKLNQSELQVKYFILPCQLMKLKYIDPYSRQRIVEAICNYLSSQKLLKGVVLEQASVTLADLCRLLLAISHNSRVSRLYLWDVLDKCQLPFRGSLKRDSDLDDQPTIPYTYNPGGRKYLKQLEKLKREKGSFKNTGTSLETDAKPPSDLGENFSTLTEYETSWLEHLLLSTHTSDVSIGNSKTMENYKVLDWLCGSSDMPTSWGDVKTQFDVGTQTHILSGSKTSFKCSCKTTDSKKTKSSFLIEIKRDICKRYLKVYENCEVGLKTLREIYMVALSGLTNLTILSINYGLLADGSGEALLSIGSVMNGRLKDLELLCRQEELPSPPHQRCQQTALQTIPDIVWQRIKKECPNLRVSIVCVAESDVTMRFVTRSVPLHSLHLLYSFSPTLVSPQLTFFSTLKFLRLNFQDSLENITIIFWHSSGSNDSALKTFIKDSRRLRYFEYCGPLQNKGSISKLCDAALHSNSEIVRFKLQIQGDPCFPHIAEKLIDELIEKYQPKFADRCIEFVLKTHNV